MSKESDAPGAGEDSGKGERRRTYCLTIRIWAYGKEPCDCHPEGWGATERVIFRFKELAPWVSSFCVHCGVVKDTWQMRCARTKEIQTTEGRTYHGNF
jgi:hypothetical protein